MQKIFVLMSVINWGSFMLISISSFFFPIHLGCLPLSNQNMITPLTSQLMTFVFIWSVVSRTTSRPAQRR